MNQFSPINCALIQALGGNPATSTGVTVTTSATINTKGSWTTLATAGFTFERMTIMGRVGSANYHAFDIGIDDGAGNVSVIAEDLFLSNVAGNGIFDLALHVPSGSLLKVRAERNASAAGTMVVAGHGYSHGVNGAPGFSRLIRMTAKASSRGVDGTSGASNSGVRQELLSAASNVFDVKGLVWGQQFGASGTILASLECGASGSEEVILPYQWLQGMNTGIGFVPHIATIHRNFPAGTRFSAFVQAASTAQSYTYSLHGYQ